MKKLILFIAIVIFCGTSAATAQTDTVKNRKLVEADINPEFPGGVDSIGSKISDPIPDIWPEFPGGPDSMFAFLYRIIKYPKKAIRKNITGVVYVTFIVEKDGQISNAKILRDIGGGCGKEVLRVINAMPKWKPGILDGEPIRTELLLPITFNLENNVSEEHDREFLQTTCDEF